MIPCQTPPFCTSLGAVTKRVYHILSNLDSKINNDIITVLQPLIFRFINICKCCKTAQNATQKVEGRTMCQVDCGIPQNAVLSVHLRLPITKF